MTENPVLIPCSHCRGTGSVEFTGEYADTLAILRNLGGEVTGAELSRQFGIAPTAMNNRLVILERMGLAVSRAYGRKKFYRATTEGR